MSVEKNSLLIKINLIILILSLIFILFLEENLQLPHINICNITNSNLNHFYTSTLHIKKIRNYKNITFLSLEPTSHKSSQNKYSIINNQDTNKKRCSYTGIIYNKGKDIKLNRTNYKFTFKVITYKGKKELLIYKIENIQ